MNIFTYGTLRKEGGLYCKLDDREPIGQFKTLPKYTLYDVGCPCLSHGGNTSVVGDVYQIEDLGQIVNVHNMEVRAGYTLERVELVGFTEPVYAYFQTPEPGWETPIIPSGDWIDYVRKEREVYSSQNIR